MEAAGIALSIVGGANNPLRDDFTHCTSRSKISKRVAGTIEPLAHCQGHGVVEPNVLDCNDIHRDLPKSTSGSAGATRAPAAQQNAPAEKMTPAAKPSAQTARGLKAPETTGQAPE